MLRRIYLTSILSAMLTGCTGFQTTAYPTVRTNQSSVDTSTAVPVSTTPSTSTGSGGTTPVTTSPTTTTPPSTTTPPATSTPVTTTPTTPVTSTPTTPTCGSGTILVNGTCAPIVANDAALLQPTTYQVYQRSTLSQGQMRISLAGDPSTVKVDVIVTNQSGAVLATTSDSVSFAVNTIFQKLVTVPAGSWYAVEVRQTNAAGTQVLRSRVGNVGVGDVYITAGQSNSVDSGQEPTAATSGKVVAFDPKTNSWALALDPLPAYTADMAGVGGGGSTWPTMGDVVAQSSGVPIAFVITGYGGTSIAQWQKGDPTGNFTRLRDITKQIVARTGGFRSILWHQGESDSIGATSNLPYQAQFQQMTMDLAADIGAPRLPWMLAKVSFFPANTHQGDAGACDAGQYNPQAAAYTVLAQTNLIAAGIATDGPTTDDLAGSPWRYPGAGGACVHFSKAGSIAAGQRWADKANAAPFTPYLSAPTAPLRDEVFRASWYLAQYPDVQNALGPNQYLATSHWLTYGINEGRQGSPTFSAIHYLARYADVAAGGATNYLNAIIHYIGYGIAEGRDGR